MSMSDRHNAEKHNGGTVEVVLMLRLLPEWTEKKYSKCTTRIDVYVRSSQWWNRGGGLMLRPLPERIKGVVPLTNEKFNLILSNDLSV